MVGASVEAANDVVPRREAMFEAGIEFGFGASAGDEQPPRLGLAPIPHAAESTITRVLGKRALRRRRVRREDRGRLVVDVNLHIQKARFDEESQHAIPERVISFAESDFPSLARQLETDELHDL